MALQASLGSSRGLLTEIVLSYVNATEIILITSQLFLCHVDVIDLPLNGSYYHTVVPVQLHVIVLPSVWT